MEGVIFVEVLDRRGHVAQRLRVDDLPATIGREYTSDVILDDRFVSPRHATIVRDSDGELALEDAASANGLYEVQPLRRVTRAPITGDRQFRMGQTIVRIRDVHYPVPAAVPQRGRGTGRILEGRLRCLGVFILVGALLSLDTYLASYDRLTPGPVLTRLGILAVLLMAWFGAWSLVSRVLSQRFRLAQHAAVAALGMLACVVFSRAVDYYAFAFAADRSVEVLLWGGAFGLLAVTVYSHLRWSSAAPARRLAIGAILASGTVVGLIGLLVASVYLNPSLYEWTSQPHYPAQLKLPRLRVAHSRGVEGFFSEARELKTRVDAAGREH